jgi:NAD(P)-dependent dehydrogenase (short-subunit alcohol dehydrogenase family)
MPWVARRPLVGGATSNGEHCGGRTSRGNSSGITTTRSTGLDNSSRTLDAPIEDIQAAFDVNVVGPWALIVALRHLLEAAPAARVVNISSGACQQITYLAQQPGDVGAPAYSFAKHTLNYLTVMLAAAFRNTKVLVNSVDPGRADTYPELGSDEEDVPPSVAAGWIEKAATLPDGGPSGAIFLNGQRIG